jgi:hypothetical protein
MKRDLIGAALSSVTSTDSEENNVSPFMPGTNIIVGMQFTGTANMTALIEGSVDDSTWTTLFAPGAVNFAANEWTEVNSATVVCPKYIRGTVSARTGGTVKFYKMNAF